MDEITQIQAKNDVKTLFHNILFSIKTSLNIMKRHANDIQMKSTSISSNFEIEKVTIFDIIEHMNAAVRNISLLVYLFIF